MEEIKAKLEHQKPNASLETDQSLSPETLDKVVGGTAVRGGIIVRNGDPCDGSEILAR
jgi:hypothetical protein